jgi:hypothetical protein
MAARDYINRDLFHASDLPAEEFMKAPAIHVGPLAQAEARARDTIEPVAGHKWSDLMQEKIHSTPISEHAKVYPVTLTDKQANRVHSRFLSNRGIKTSPSVLSSTLGYEGNRNFEENSLIEDRALAAMERNEVIRYVNNAEARYSLTLDQVRSGNVPRLSDVDVHSYLVPSPVINMSQMSQRALPMDYSGIVESETTKSTRKQPR